MKEPVRQEVVCVKSSDRCVNIHHINCAINYERFLGIIAEISQNDKKNTPDTPLSQFHTSPMSTPSKQTTTPTNEFKCCICQCYPPDSVFSCKQNPLHFVCGDCRSNMSSSTHYVDELRAYTTTTKCPLCRADDFSRVKNDTLGSMFAVVPTPCPHSGCQESLPVKDMHDHSLNTCRHRTHISLHPAELQRHKNNRGIHIGDSYNGQVDENNLPHGQGTASGQQVGTRHAINHPMVPPESTFEFSGRWMHGLPEGHGDCVVTCSTPTRMTPGGPLCIKVTYAGEYHGGKLHGKGKTTIHFQGTTATNATDAPPTEEDADPEPIVLETYKTFEEMGLDERVMRGLIAYGFEKPSTIQQTAICAFTKYTRDLIAQAQSGTGKTATFSVALLQMIDEASDDLQGIILVNTQELAGQIHAVISSIGQFTERRIALVTGGSSIRRSIDELDRMRPHVIVATPGRLLQYLHNRYIDVSKVKYFVLDEADQMLSDGFTEEVREVVRRLPEDTKIGLYSATMPPEMDAAARKFMRHPIEIRVKEEEQTLEGIRQYRIDLEREEQRFPCLMDLFSETLQSQMMIYCNSKRTVDDLKYRLDHEQVPCEAIHDKMIGDERKAIMKDFRSGKVRVLVTTDLTARGIDVQQVSLVINYEFPHDTAMYLHRIGRSGRFSRKGCAINFVVHDRSCRRFDRNLNRHVSDPDSLARVEEYYQTQIMEMMPARM